MFADTRIARADIASSVVGKLGPRHVSMLELERTTRAESKWRIVSVALGVSTDLFHASVETVGAGLYQLRCLNLAGLGLEHGGSDTREGDVQL